MSLLSDLWLGAGVAVAVAIAAQFLADHYGAPAMLIALLFGIAIHFLSEEERCWPGIEYCASTALQLGVALLGMHIGIDLLTVLGARTVLLLVRAIMSTVCFGLVAACLMGRGWRLALLTSCGASAAVAITAILPRNQFSDQKLVFTVISVTVLSTAAMVFYPVLTESLGLVTNSTGIFFGVTIHDVAQVVGAGFSISPEVGETATVVKLIRVPMLVASVILYSYATRAVVHATVPQAKMSAIASSRSTPFVPRFVIAVVLLAVLNSSGAFSEFVVTLSGDASRWALLVGIVAVRMKISVQRVRGAGADAVVLIVAERVFLMLFILLGIFYLGRTS